MAKSSGMKCGNAGLEPTCKEHCHACIEGRDCLDAPHPHECGFDPGDIAHGETGECDCKTCWDGMMTEAEYQHELQCGDGEKTFSSEHGHCHCDDCGGEPDAWSCEECIKQFWHWEQTS